MCLESQDQRGRSSEGGTGSREHPRWPKVKNPPTNAGDTGHAGSALGREGAPEGKWQPTPVFLPGPSHGQRGLAGYSP